MNRRSMLGSCFEFRYSSERIYRTSPGTMRGLMNYGLTCCVNALLQSFFATRELKRLLEMWTPVNTDKAYHSIPLQLRNALLAMESDQRTLDPHSEFLRCLHNHRIQTNVQHDANEVFLSILNFTLQQIDDSTLAGQIRSLYRVDVETHLQCMECSAVQSGTSYLLSLPLHLKEGENSLDKCVQSFFELQDLTGRNSCYCNRCDSKTPSKQGLKLAGLPPILCLHLERFRSHWGSTRKLGCRVTFPETVDFLETLQDDHLSSGFNKTKIASCYRLYAVVVHTGSAMFGHYVAYVHHHGNLRWYYADDSHVEESSWEEVQKTYGASHGVRECYRNTAYMLLYRRIAKEEQVEGDLNQPDADCNH